MFKLPEYAKSRQSSASTAELERIESTLSCKLPADYREFLETCNGASINMPPDNMGAAVRVEWLRSEDLSEAASAEVAEYETTYFIVTIWPVENVISEMEQFFVYGDQSLGFLPRHYLPISHDNGGSDYVIDVSDGPQRGYVYLWPVNMNVSFGGAQNEHIGFVAKSFTEFVTEKIISPPEDW